MQSEDRIPLCYQMAKRPADRRINLFQILCPQPFVEGSLKISQLFKTNDLPAADIVVLAKSTPRRVKKPLLKNQPRLLIRQMQLFRRAGMRRGNP